MADVLFNNYTNLKLTIGKWLDRTDLVEFVPGFIKLAEAEIDRVLRRTVARATITISTDTTSLDDGIAELRSVRLVTAAPRRDVVLDVVTPEMLAETRSMFQSTGRPVAASVIGGQLVVAPAPDQAYSAEIVYFSSLIPLDDTVASNVVLVEAPDLYLYGALSHSAPFLQHDERVEVWRTFFINALEQLHNRREREEHGANLRPIRLPVVFGARP